MKNKKLKPLIWLGYLLVLAGYIFIQSQNLNPLYADGAFFWAAAISIAVLLWVIIHFWEFISARLNDQNNQPQNIFQIFSGLGVPKKVFVLVAIPWVFFIIMSVLSVPLISYNAYRGQLGEPEKRTFSSDIQVVDMNQLPIVDMALAQKLADKKLGEKPSLGSQVMLGEPTLQMVNDKLTWVVPLHHSGLFKWLANMSGTPGYVTVSATDINDVKYVEDYKIKYQPNSYLLHDLLRHVRFSGGLFTGVTDYSFELDDTGRPYWVVTTYQNKIGFALPEATGVFLVDAGTGEMQRYTVETLPDWVDRVQPENFLINQINNQGEYVHGPLNFSNRDKFRASRGQAIIYNDGDCYLLTCITSVGTDESAIGFMMVDMVTKKTYLYEMAGATEYSAQSSAEGKVQHLGYKASSPIIINVSGQPTYFMTLKDKEGLIKQYAMVSVVNYSNVGTGETVAQAMRDYQKALSTDSSLSMGNQTEAVEITGTVGRVAAEYNGSATVYKLTLDQKPGMIFLADASLSDQLALTQPGDSVKITMMESDSKSVHCLGFENKSIR